MTQTVQQLFPQVQTLADLAHQGLSAASVSRRRRAGRLRRLKQGVYVDPTSWQSWEPGERCLAQHIAQVKTRPSGVLSHQSAALWMGAPLLKLPSKVHLTYASFSGNQAPGLSLHRGRPEVVAASSYLLGARITSPQQTLLDLALSVPLLEALVAGDFLLRKGFLGLAEARASLETLQRPKAQRLAQRLSDQSDSPAETIARNLIHDWNLPLPREQFEIWTPYGKLYRADFAWPEQGVLLEVDGEVKYSGAYGNPQEVIRAEHRRQRELEAAGWRIIRVRWKELVEHPLTLRQRLWEAGVR